MNIQGKIIPRDVLVERIKTSIERNPVTALTGPRQCGKTTIARWIAEGRETFMFDLEEPADLAGLQEAPMVRLGKIKGLVIIDEVQRMPELFQILRVLVDRESADVRFLLLGSASPDLVKGVSESLAGRIAFINMSGFHIGETGLKEMDKLWFRGGFPRSFLAVDEEASFHWRLDFIRTFLERDLPALGIRIPASTLRRFWIMTAHYHGQVWNGSEFARALGSSQPTARKYLDILEEAFVIHQLLPWHANLKKRQVKSQKVFIRDSGILHALLGLDTDKILNHPKLGYSWEGFIMEQLREKFPYSQFFFWSTFTGAELDLFMIHKGENFGFEMKYNDAPRISKSMHQALNDLKLKQLFVIYPGDKYYELHPKITVIPASKLDNINLD